MRFLRGEAWTGMTSTLVPVPELVPWLQLDAQGDEEMQASFVPRATGSGFG